MKFKEPVLGKVDYDYITEAQEELGMSGAMLSGAKVEPEGQTIYWNACVFNSEEVQIWHGDLNITKSKEKLQRLANRIGLLYVTPEQPFRFKGLAEGRKSYSADRILKFTPENP